MDWTNKHFNQAAIFNAPPESVLEAARAVAAEAFEGVEDTADGFVARGFRGWHSAAATFHITPAASRTQVAVELLVKRAAMRGYMLFDIGGYYNGQIDRWFSAIAQRLGGAEAQVLVSKTTANLRVRQGCLRGCLVYLVAGTCLAVFAIPLDRALFPQLSASTPGPFVSVASVIGFAAGVAAFLYVMYPEASVSKSIRARLPGNQDKARP